MKKLSVLGMLILVAMFSFNVKADIITLDGANEIANAFFANSASSQKKQMKSTTQLEYAWDSNSLTQTGSSMMKSVDEDPTFYVFNNPDGEGFVIVSGEETANPIIGYSLEGKIDNNDLPIGFVGFMTEVDAQIRTLREYNATKSQNVSGKSLQKSTYDYDATTMGNIVKDLKTAPWGQSSPFNKLCFTATGEQAKTGCGPTAFAILCHYYKWPKSGVGTVTHQGTGENMELGHEYDYDSMRADNYPTGYTQAEADAVALLMRDLGWANQVGYGTSSTTFTETGQHMVDHFKFKSERPVDHGASLAVVRETLNNDAQWKNYIETCLDAEQPIPYSSTTGGVNRHIYILDGYTDNDYYHFNWGWGGNYNGWFTLDNMNTPDGSDYTGSHKAYFNLIPDTNVTVSVEVDETGSVTINGESLAYKEVEAGTQVTLQTTDSNFYGWMVGNDVVSTENPYTFTATATQTYTAKFLSDGNTVDIFHTYLQDDEDIKANCSVTGLEENGASYPLGVNLTITANCNRGYAFEGWYTLDETLSPTKELSTDNPYTFTTSEETIAIYYSFEKLSPAQFTVTTADANMGTATWSFQGVQGDVYAGEEITLTAEAKSGYMFTGWSDGTSTISNSKTCTVAVEEGKTYTANFALAGADYTVSYNTGTFGDFTYNSRASVWKYNTSETNPVLLQLTATNASGAEVGAIYKTSNRLYAYGGDANSSLTTPTTYTLSVPDGFIITSYTLDYIVGASYSGKVTIANANSSNTPTDTQQYTLSASNLSDSSTSFTITGNANTQYVTVKSFVVSVLSTGGEPEPDPDPEVSDETLALIQSAKTLVALEGIGYPAATAKATLQSAIATAEANPTAAAGTTLQTAIDAYYATNDIVKPEAGNTYTFIVGHTSPKSYIYNNNGVLSLATYSGGELPSTAHFTCEVVDGKYQFVSGGKYMPYPKYDNGNLQTTSSSYTKFTVGKILNGGDVAATNQNLFGLVYLKGTREKPNATPTQMEEAYIVVQYAANADNSNVPSWDQALSTYGNANFTSAIKIEEVTPEATGDASAELQKIYYRQYVGRGTTSEEFTKLLLNADGATTATSATISLEGTTNIADVTAVKIYSTATDSTFTASAATLLASLTGTDITTGDITVNLNNAAISQGTNYLWLTCDVAENATEGNAIKATIKNITVGGNQKDLTQLSGTTSRTVMLNFEVVYDLNQDGSKYYRIPALIKAADNSLVAVSDKRFDELTDLPNSISIVSRRSTDNGKTWSAPVAIASKNDEVKNKYGDAAIMRTKEGNLVAVFVGNNGLGDSDSSNLIRLYQSTSTNNGQSWSTPTDITESIYSQVYDGTRGMGTTRYGMFAGSGHALTTESGRLMFVVAARSTDLVQPLHNFAVYSDDNGQSWTVSTNSPTNSSNKGDEAKVVELLNGDILMSIRNPEKVYRKFSLSTDGGATWSSATTGSLIDPACNGDIIRYNYNGRNYLIHSLCGSSSDRTNVTIYLSADEGTTWNVSRQLVNGMSAYSSLEVLNDGSIGCFVEVGKHVEANDIGMRMTYFNFSFEWLLNGTTEYNVTASANVQDGGTVTQSATKTISNGKVWLTAEANEGYTFTGWTKNGQALSSDTELYVTVTEATTCVANFEAIPVPTYNVTISVDGNGSVEKSVESVEEGGEVTLTATADDGYKFTKWSDESTENPRTITSVTDHINLIAYFEAVPQGNTPLLTFACLSDLHAQEDFITDANNIRLRESATKTLSKIKKEENVDLIVLGGDYTSNSYIPQTSWQVTKDSLIEASRGAFKGTKKPVIYVNGNHDYEVAYANVAYSDGTPKTYNAGEYYGTPMKTDIGALAAEDCFYETATNTNGTPATVDLLAAYHYVVNGFDFVVLNTGKNFFASASDYSYSIESVNWCASKLEQIYASDPTKTVFFLVHVPFSDSKGISDVNKGMNKGVDAEFVTKLKTTLAKYPNLIMLYGHDHGTDSAYIREATEERVTEYATDGSVYTGEGASQENLTYYIQKYNKNEYLGFNSYNLAITDSPTETTITLVDNTTDKFYINLSNTTTTDADGYPINYLFCGSSGRFSGNNSPKPQGVETDTNIMLFEVADPDASTITATQVNSIDAGKTYMLVAYSSKAAGYYALTDEMYNYEESKSQRMVGAAVTITDGTITYTPGKASVLWTINKKPSATEKSFFSSFMGSMRYYGNSFEDGQINPRRIIQALMVYVYSDRVELKMKNYGEGDVTSNGITVNQDLDPYVSYRTVTHSAEAVTATPTITPQGGVVNPGSITVTVDAQEWHNLYYTINGDNPTESSDKVVDGQITFTASEGNYTVKVAAQEGIRQMSPVVSETYTVMNTHGITVSTNGEGGTASFTIEGDNVILTASEPAEGYYFVGWSVGESEEKVSKDLTYTTAIVENAAYKANYAKLTFNVNVSATNGGTVKLLIAGEETQIPATVEYGTEVTFSAEANQGYQFVNWTGAEGNPIIVIEPEYTHPVKSDITLTANFDEVTPEEIYAEMCKPTVIYGNVMEVTRVDIENAVRGAAIGTVSLEDVPLNVSGTNSRHNGATAPVSIYPRAEFDLELTLNTGTWFGMQFYQFHNSTVVASYGYYGANTTADTPAFWSEVTADDRIETNQNESKLTFHIALSNEVKVGDIVVFRALSAKNTEGLDSVDPCGSFVEGAYLDILFKVVEPVDRTVKVASNNRDLGYAGYVSHQLQGTATDVTTSVPVTVRAYLQPGAYCRFVNWTINEVVVGTNPDSYTYEGVAPATITANFVETCMVSVSSSDVNMGTATMSVSTPVVDKNTEVTFIAEAAEDYKFVRWTNQNGELVSEESSYTTAITSHTQLIAEFAQKTTYRVVVTGGTANGSADSEIEKGTEVEFIANKINGQEFVNWTSGEDIVSTDETFTIKLVGDIEITANFQEVQGGGEEEEVLPNTSYCVGTAPNNGDGNHYAINKIVAKVNGTEVFTWNSNGSNVEDISSTCAIEIKAGDVITFVMSSITNQSGLHSSWAQAVIYFDWNQNGVWTDSGESTILFKNPGVAQVDKEFTITVPNTFAWSGDINAFKFRLNSGEAPQYNTYGDATPCQALAKGMLATFKAKKPATTTVTPSRTISAIANFADGSAGTVTVNGSNSGSATAEGTITLVATQGTNSQFVNWTLNGEVVSTEATITDNSAGNKLYVANFKKTLNRSSWEIYTVSSAYSGLDGSYYVDGGKAIDGNNNTYWHTDWSIASNKKVPQWIVFNLGSVETFDSFNYLSRSESQTANGNIGGYKLYVSTEAPDLNNLTGDMEEVNSGTFSYPGQEHKIELGKAVRGQYVMLYATSTYGTDNQNNLFANCAEFYLYASDDYKTQVDLTKVSGTNATVKVTTDAPATITVGTDTYTTTAGNLTAEISTQSNDINIVAFGGNITNVDLGENVAPVSFPETVTEIALRNTGEDEVVVDAPALNKITVVSDVNNKVAKVSTTSDLSQGVQVVVEKEIKTPCTVDGKVTPTIYNFLSMPFAFNTSSIKYWDGDSWEAVTLETHIRVLMYNSSERANGSYSNTWEILKSNKDIAANQGFVVIGNNDFGATVKLQFTSAVEAYDGSVESVVAKPYRKDSGETSVNDADWNFNGVPYLTSGKIGGYTLYFHTGYEYNSVVPAIAAETSISAYQGVMYQAEVTNNISKYIPVETASVARNTNASEDVFARAYISIDDANPAKIILSDESSENFVVNEDAWYLAPTANSQAAAYFNVGGAEASVSVQPAASELPMAVYTGAGTQHRITLTATDGNYDVYLKDAVTNDVVCLNDEDYNFTAAAKTTIANRFTVSMVEPTGIIDAARAEGAIKAVVTANGIKLFGTEEGDEVTLYNANGMIITNATAEDGVTTIATSATGVIIIKVADQTVKVVK